MRQRPKPIRDAAAKQRREVHHREKEAIVPSRLPFTQMMRIGQIQRVERKQQVEGKAPEHDDAGRDQKRQLGSGGGRVMGSTEDGGSTGDKAVDIERSWAATTQTGEARPDRAGRLDVGPRG